MEVCLHFRGAALNANEAGVSRATEDEDPLRTAVAKAIILPLWGPRGITCWSLMTLERSGKGLSLQTAVCLTERSELWMVAFFR